MGKVRLTLEFACCHCGDPVAVTVECLGSGGGGERLVASVGIPCPECHRINQVYFDPRGAVQAVEPYRVPQRIPEPSLN